MREEYRRVLANSIAWLLDNGPTDPVAIADHLLATGAVVDRDRLEDLVVKWEGDFDVLDSAGIESPTFALRSAITDLRNALPFPPFPKVVQ